MKPTSAGGATGKPRLLDLFCGAGGAAMGYHRAGFEVVGVDIKPQPRYPFEFIQDDAIRYASCGDMRQYAAIHASPPCQAYSWSAKRWNKAWEDKVDETREILSWTGKPYVIENVLGAPLQYPVMLCGTMFELGVIRHRYFEINPRHAWLVPDCQHNGSVSDGDYVTVAGHGGDGKAALHLWKAAMGIDWMTKEELTQAIPPAYTEWIGRQLLKAVSL